MQTELVEGGGIYLEKYLMDILIIRGGGINNNGNWMNWRTLTTAFMVEIYKDNVSKFTVHGNGVNKFPINTLLRTSLYGMIIRLIFQITKSFV